MRIYIPMKNFNARKDLIASISIALFTWMFDRSIKTFKENFYQLLQKNIRETDLNTVKKILTSLVFIISATTASAQDSKIAIADLTWTGATAIGHIIQAIITGPMGGEAEIIKGASDGSIIFASMDKGDGSIDVHPDIWMPVQSNNWEKYIEENNTVAINKPYNGTQGMFIPYYLKDKITSFSDLANPAIASMFDKDGNGKGEYWAGDTSWTSTKIWQVKFKSYGLDELWEPEIVSDETFKNQLKIAYDNQKPILFYYWTPEWIFAAYDLSQIEEPLVSEGCKVLNLDHQNWLEASTFSCKHTDAEVWIGHSKSLEDRNPAVARMLSNIALSPETINEWTLKIGRDGENPINVAESWVAKNIELVNNWIYK